MPRTIKLMTDACYHPESRLGFRGMVALFDTGEEMVFSGDLGTLRDSAQAEYAAAAWAVEYLLARGYRKAHLRFCTDHQALWMQLTRLAPPPARRHLVGLFRRIRRGLQQFRSFECSRIDRSGNRADGLGRARMREVLGLDG